MLSEFLRTYNEIEDQTMHVYIMRLKTKRCMRGSVIIWWSICGHIMVCRSVVIFDMHIVSVSLVDVDNLTFEF